MKEKFLVLWIIAAGAYGVFISHFWAWAAYALEKTVALGFLSFSGLAMFAADICGVHFLA